jgi:hypothetical protein
MSKNHGGGTRERATSSNATMEVRERGRSACLKVEEGLFIARSK